MPSTAERLQSGCRSTVVRPPDNECGGNGGARYASALPMDALVVAFSPFRSGNLATLSHLQIVAPVSTRCAASREQADQLLLLLQRSIPAARTLKTLSSSYPTQCQSPKASSVHGIWSSNLTCHFVLWQDTQERACGRSRCTTSYSFIFDLSCAARLYSLAVRADGGPNSAARGAIGHVGGPVGALSERAPDVGEVIYFDQLA